MASQYAQIADLENYISAAALAGIPTSVLNTLLINASARADAALAAQFTLPLTAWSGDLTEAVAKIAVCNAMIYRGFKPGSTMDEVIVDAKNDAERWLERVAKQQWTPQVTDSSPAAAPGVTSATGPKVFSRPRRGWDGQNPLSPGGGTYTPDFDSRDPLP
ncbi:MAG: phage protein Gp36 family protein [Thermoplasmataceae archaeon]